MAKYTFETEDRREFLTALQGEDCLFVLWDLMEWVRGELKWNDKLKSQETITLERVRQKVIELLEDRGINLDNIE